MADEKLPCKWRLNPRFQYECKVCHNMDQNTCPMKVTTDTDYDEVYVYGFRRCTDDDGSFGMDG
jgi:hypothetical protein